MVNQSVFFGLILECIISLALPIIAIFYYRKKGNFSWRPVWIGALTFFIFSQVLEKVLHVYVLTLNQTTSQIINHPYWFAVYGALAAGIFEEVGRFIAFKFWLKKNRDYKDGISYGLGHGGIEAILIGTMASIQYFVLGLLINSGQLDTLLAQKGAPVSVIEPIKNLLVNASPYTFFLGSFERIFAFALQIALSIMVLHAVKQRKYWFLLLAILLHALTDFFPALYQSGKMSLMGAESVIFAVGILSIVFIKKSKKLFV